MSLSILFTNDTLLSTNYDLSDAGFHLLGLIPLYNPFTCSLSGNYNQIRWYEMDWLTSKSKVSGKHSYSPTVGQYLVLICRFRKQTRIPKLRLLISLECYHTARIHCLRPSTRHLVSSFSWLVSSETSNPVSNRKVRSGWSNGQTKRLVPWGIRYILSPEVSHEHDMSGISISGIIQPRLMPALLIPYMTSSLQPLLHATLPPPSLRSSDFPLNR